MMLQLDQVHAYYGKSHILHGVSLEVNKGELVTLLGRNGAGKTTTLKSIMGLMLVRSGSIRYKGENILGRETHQIFRRGLGYVPQGRRIFSSLSVAENLRLPSLRQDGEKIEWVLNIFPPLRERLNNRGNELSGGEQQMLAIARVLVSGAELILLDEPSEGLAPLLVGAIMDTIRELKKSGLTMLLVEANLTMASNLGDRHYVMAHGLVSREASSQEILEDVELHRKYFKL
ncbi:MAG: ABC transporter ATP-binding protein [Deltaproteobacteria bacterium]|nr:ABC transporter ATP-binding protein [Deltaproteobacteria bacterium]MDP3038854.1 ABC transporter ATP-binding protein [Deltaproteobacteria bacterium]